MLLSHIKSGFKLGLKSGVKSGLHLAGVPRCTFRTTSFHSNRLLSRYPQNDQIYIHQVPESDTVKYSYSPQTNAVNIGQSRGNTRLSPHGFEANPTFVQIVHNTIANKITKDFSFIMEAGVNVDSFMPIYDFRETPRHARVPEIENIFGYVQVDAQGKIVPGSYQDNVMYRVYSGTGGLPKLSEYMYEEVQKACESQEGL